VVADGDIHDLPASDWGVIPGEAIGEVVVVEVLCAHPYGLGVRIVGYETYGHVNSPRVADGYYELATGQRLIGRSLPARVLAAGEIGRQTTLTLRPSDVSRESAEPRSWGTVVAVAAGGSSTHRQVDAAGRPSGRRRADHGTWCVKRRRRIAGPRTGHLTVDRSHLLGWLMQMSARNRLTQVRQPVTQKLEDPGPDACSWIWVLPVPDGRIRIARIVVPRHLADTGEWFGEEDVTTESVRFVDHVDRVDDVVRGLGGDPDALESPWRNDFPL
jgi:hypothetical protein